ncbi:MAG TPA: hypothetical protein VLV76_15630 [Candidatus Acidoferrum sp.]|nr:hypothetical protein [Candidatus Acidoferrum sp.]
MRVPIIIPAAVVTLMLAPGTYAAPVNASQTCSALESQFDHAAQRRPEAAQMADAKVLRTEGAKLCSTAMARSGVTYLQSALKYIGETPRT